MSTPSGRLSCLMDRATRVWAREVVANVASTPTIAVLDTVVVDQMAAGEVVERPASVAKELVENALDAGASLVQVSLKDGGLTAIEVQDDGSGMLPDDAQRCILRHATSKLRQTADLMHLKTLGFRGEALSSIASVSRFTLTTRPRSAEMGYRMVVHGGVVQSARAMGCPVGTQVRIEELFYNVPARRKFMRAPATEQAHVQEALLKVILARDQGGLVLSSGSRRLLDVPKNASAGRRAALALGDKLGTSVVIDQETGGIGVTGLLAAQPLDRGESRRIWLFVNGRFVRDRSLQRAVLAVCKDAFSVRPPTALVYIDLPPSEVDVNVHPQKLEVRFARGAAVHKAVTDAVAEAVGAWQRAEAQRMHAASGADETAVPVYGGRLGQRAFRGATAPTWRPGPGAQRPAPSGRPWRASTAGTPLPSQPQHALISASAAAPSLPGLAPEPERGAFWRQLVPLGIAPLGHLCCRSGGDLAIVHLVHAQKGVLLAALLPQDEPLAGEALMLPPTWVPADALAAAVDDYVIESADAQSPWGVTLEAVGPGHYVVVSVPSALTAFSPVQVAQNLVAALMAAKMTCHNGFASSKQTILHAWLDGLLADWPGPAHGSALVWGPGFLHRLAAADVPTKPPVVRHLQAADVARLS